MRGFYIGRFQPFHLGHREVIEDITEDLDELVIAIGSAQESHTVRNPYSAGERIRMITKAIEDIECTTYVIPIEDINRNSLWVSHIKSISPPFDVVYSNNPLVVRLFSEEGVQVERNHLIERDKYRGKEIRRRMINGEDWRDLVPDEVDEIIDQINGIERLRDIAEDDVRDDSVNK